MAREANGYTFAALPSAPLRTGSAGLDRKAPWFQIKEGREAAATSVYVTRSVRAIDSLKTLVAPVLLHSSQKIHAYLGWNGQLRCAASGTQQVVEYQGETRSHLLALGAQAQVALTCDHGGAVGTWAVSALPALKGAFGSGAGAAGTGASVQDAGRERIGGRCGAVGGVSGEQGIGYQGAGAHAPAPYCC